MILREKQKAVFYKDQGNKCLKNGKINDAIIYYSKGIEADPANALLYSNRAMANLKQEKYQLVVQDCDKSIQLDAMYHKSFLRRGTAHFKLSNISEAEKDFKIVLELQPDNKEAQIELNKIKLVKENQSGLATSNNIVMPVKKPIGKRSKVALKRIHVEEVKNERPSVKLTSEAGFIRSKEKPTESSLASSYKNRGTESAEMKIEEIVSESSQNVEPKETKGRLISPVDIGVLKAKSESDNQEKTICNRKSNAGDSAKTAQMVRQCSISCPDSEPTSSLQFITDFRRFQQSPEVLYQYLSLVEPAKLPKLIPHSSFDAKVLMTILNILRNFYMPNKNKPIYPVLLNLTQIKRFSTIAMFLSKSEKQIVNELFDFVNTNEQVLESDLSKLKKLFSLYFSFYLIDYVKITSQDFCRSWKLKHSSQQVYPNLFFSSTLCFDILKGIG